MNQYIRPHFTESALITIDTQNDFTFPNAPAYIPGTEAVIPNMVRLLDRYRDQGRLIIHVIRLYLRDGSNVDVCRRQLIEEGKEIVIPGTNGADLVQALKPDDNVRLAPDELLAGSFQQIATNEFVMYKPRWGAFYQTGLEPFLKQGGINTLVFSGCNYPNCPRASLYEASERDFRLVLVKDAVSQLYPKGIEELRGIGVNVLATDELEACLA